MKFSEKVHFLRHKRKMTQDELAEQVNVTQAALSYWEKGDTRPSKNTMIQLAKVLDVDLDVLMDDERSVEA